MSTAADIPAGFVPTTTNPRWRGQIRCAYCRATGWPQPPTKPLWMSKHGPDCKHRPPP